MAVATNNSRQGSPGDLTINALATALTGVAVIFAFADISGANFNPAVTFGMILTGNMGIGKGSLYIIIQCLASLCATGWLLVVFPSNPNDPLQLVNNTVVAMSPNASIGNAFAMEFTLTFILVYVIFATAVNPHNDDSLPEPIGQPRANQSKVSKIHTAAAFTKHLFSPIAIGFTLGFLAYMGNTVSGGAYNPARAFGPAMISGNHSNHWVYWVADLLGGGIAATIQTIFFSQKRFLLQSLTRSNSWVTRK